MSAFNNQQEGTQAKMLFAAALVKIVSRRYPGYNFSSCHACAVSYAYSKPVFKYQATAYYKDGDIQVEAQTLPELQNNLKTALENHFVKPLIVA